MKYLENGDAEVAGTNNGIFFRSLGTDALNNDISAWTQVGGGSAFSYASHLVTAPGTIGIDGDWLYAGSPEWRDGTLLLRFKFVSLMAGGAGIHFSNPGSRQYGGIFVTQGGSSFAILKFTGGSTWTSLGTQSHSALTNGTFYWWAIKASGTSYTVTLYNDSSGALGSQIATKTVTVSDTICQKGAVALWQDITSSAALIWGGAFASVCQVYAADPGNAPRSWPGRGNDVGEGAAVYSSDTFASGSRSFGIWNGKATDETYWPYRASDGVGAENKNVRIGAGGVSLPYSVKIKTASVTGTGAFLRWIEWDAAGTVLRDQQLTTPLSGTNAFTLKSGMTPATLPTTAYASIRLQLTGSGQAWFDELSLADDRLVLALVSGKDVKVKLDTAEVDDAVEERSTAKLLVEDPAGTTFYQKGQPVELWMAASTEPTNLACNGSFEGVLADVSTYWTLTPPSTWSLDAASANRKVGDQALKAIRTSTTASSWDTASQTIPVTPSVSYAVRFWTKQNAGVVQSHFKVEWYKADGTTPSAIRTVDFIQAGTDNAQPWTPYSATLYPPGDAAFMVLRCMAGWWDGTDGIDATTWYDGVEVIGTLSQLPVLRFSGSIDKPTWVRPSPNDPMLHHSLGCIDNHYLIDKRTVAKTYANQTCAYIVNDLITTYFASEGITAGTIETGPTLTEAIFNYVKGSRAMDGLAEKAGKTWWVDVTKKLQFVDRTTSAAPFNPAAADMLEGSITVQGDAPLYRNKQYIRAGKDTTASQTEIQFGDAQKRAFLMGFPVNQVPTVEVSVGGGGYTSKTVGIKGLDTGKDWYWQKGDTAITQDTAGTLLAATDKIRVTYVGEFDLVVVSQDDAKINERLTVEGGSGIVEDVFDDATINARDVGFQTASSKIAKYGVVGRTLKFRTKRIGLAPGQLITVTLSDHNVTAAQMLISNVRYSTQQGVALWHDIVAIEGPVTGSWAKFFDKLAQKSDGVLRQNISTNSVLALQQTLSETWTLSEAVVESPYTCPLPNTTLQPATTLFPC